MIRKSLTVFFILLANIILLAHAVIPHHSHQNEVCIGNSPMQAYSAAHNNCTYHEHGNKHEAEDCNLNQVVVVLSQQLKAEIKCFDCVTNHSQFDGFQVQLLIESVDPLSFSNFSDHRLPLSLFDYRSFVGNQMGLRGPPIV